MTVVRESVVLEAVFRGSRFYSFSPLSYGSVIGAGGGGGGGRVGDAHGVLCPSSLLGNVQAFALGEHLGVEGPETRICFVGGVIVGEDLLYLSVDFLSFDFLGFFGEILELAVGVRRNPVGDSLLPVGIVLEL